MVLCSTYGDLGGLGGLGNLDGLDGPDWFCRATQKQAPGFTRSLFLVSYQRVRKAAQLLAVLPSQSNTKTTQRQSCSSNN